MPDFTITVSPEWAQRFAAACERRRAQYVSVTGLPDPTPTELGLWCLKRLGREFIERSERATYDESYNPDPLGEGGEV